MVNPHMNLRAVICDIYGTLLAVKPPPQDTESRWIAFWNSIPEMKRQLRFDDFSAITKQIIAREHAAARAAGVAYPEILWPRILEEAVPELANLSPEARENLLWQQAQFLHTVTLMPGAAEALRQLRAKDIILGLASNSQPYTLRELDLALASAGLSRQLFDPNLCFFSFEHGFSKPDPAVFRLLTKRLQKQNISVNQALMIGNRLDNDVLPARAAGWQAWHFTEELSAQSANAGNWEQFSRWLDQPPESRAQTT
jgi:putative hydrolase of the HAD superfamily